MREEHATQAANLTGRVALVTGAGVGIGRAIALALAGAGAAVGIHFHRSREGAEETSAQIHRHNGQAHLLPGDLTCAEQAERAVDALIEKAGRLDILVNNAGSPLDRCRIEDCSLELWRRVFDVNVTSA